MHVKAFLVQIAVSYFDAKTLFELDQAVFVTAWMGLKRHERLMSKRVTPHTRLQSLLRVMDRNSLRFFQGPGKGVRKYVQR